MGIAPNPGYLLRPHGPLSDVQFGGDVHVPLTTAFAVFLFTSKSSVPEGGAPVFPRPDPFFSTISTFPNMKLLALSRFQNRPRDSLVTLARLKLDSLYLAECSFPMSITYMGDSESFFVHFHRFVSLTKFHVVAGVCPS
jgi:hypothetical protein